MQIYSRHHWNSSLSTFSCRKKRRYVSPYLLLPPRPPPPPQPSLSAVLPTRGVRSCCESMQRQGRGWTCISKSVASGLKSRRCMLCCNLSALGGITLRPVTSRWLFPPLNLPGNNWTGEAGVSTCWKSDIFRLLIADPSFSCQLLKLIIISLLCRMWRIMKLCLNIQYNLLILGSQRWWIRLFIHAPVRLLCDFNMWKSRVYV